MFKETGPIGLSDRCDVSVTVGIGMVNASACFTSLILAYTGVESMLHRFGHSHTAEVHSCTKFRPPGPGALQTLTFCSRRKTVSGETMYTSGI